MLRVLAVLMVVAGVVLAALAAQVARRRGVHSGTSLAVLLLAVSWWGFAYALELTTDDLGTKQLWGDLKYAGVAVMGPAWLVFVLQYTGRDRWVTRPLLALLAIEPVAVMTLLLTPSWHDLVRYYPAATAGEELPVVGTGPAFWVHFAYLNTMVLVATTLFVVSMARVSRVYWRLAAVLVAAALLPWVLNALHNLGVGVFERIDLTPFAFVVTGGVLVWGLVPERLHALAPVARSVVVDTMHDAVLVLDAFDRVADANPAAAALLGRPRADLVGRRLGDLVPELARQPPAPAHRRPGDRSAAVDGSAALELELELTVQGERRHLDARRQPLPDSRGRTAGELVVLRDVTERRTAQLRMTELLAERTRIATALQSSLLPARLPALPGVTLAGRYQPAGDGQEIGGDFFDVFPLGGDAWGIALGDVSGKGAEAAAVTAQIRYTVRTLAGPDRPPSAVLAELNELMLRDERAERFCTVAYAVARPSAVGLRLTLALGGHHPPLLLPAGGPARPVGEVGTVLGLLAYPSLTDAEIQLAPGDLLCLFTDGLVEARRGPDLLGEEAVATVLERHAGAAPADVAQALEAAARAFRGGPLTDDLALLVLRVDAASPARVPPQAPPASPGAAVAGDGGTLSP